MPPGAQQFVNTSTGTTGTIQAWTVPYNGKYQFHVYGAKGSQGESTSGGQPTNGARISGVVSLNAGEIIDILVGQMGTTKVSTGNYGGGGGGGTFVVRRNGNVPLLIAAGGNGGDWGSHTGQAPGAHWSYTRAEAVHAFVGRGGSGGTFNLNGPDYNASNKGGLAFVNGGTGGVGQQSDGGFGGGGGSLYEGGGGGGWEGGRACGTNDYAGTGLPAYSYADTGLVTGITGQDAARATHGLVDVSWPA